MAVRSTKNNAGIGTPMKQTSTTITTPAISGAIVFPDGVRQTFNPDGTNSGINVGSQAGDPASPSNGDIWYDSTANELTARINGSNVSLGGGVTQTLTCGIVIDGGGSVITTGVKGFIRVPRACTITKVTVLSTDAAASSGSIVVDIWKDIYANYPPTDADSITAAAPPTLSSATKSEDSTLTGWTKSVSAGDVLGFNVDSATTVTRVLVLLEASIP